MDTSFFVTLALAVPWAAAGMTGMARDWGDTVEWPGNTGSAGGLGMSRTVALGSTGVEAHLTNVGPLRCEPREGNQPCAQVRLKGYTESPIMGASFLGGSH